MELLKSNNEILLPSILVREEPKKRPFLVIILNSKTFAMAH